MEREGVPGGPGAARYWLSQDGGGGWPTLAPLGDGPKWVLGALPCSEAVAGLGSHVREGHPTALLLHEAPSDQPETKP